MSQTPSETPNPESKSSTQSHSLTPIMKTSVSGKEYPFYPKPDDFTPVESFPDNHRWIGVPRCQGWSRQAGRQCLERASRGKQKCRSHGGSSPSGIASPNFRHGKYVSSLPMDLVDSYMELMQDEDYLALRDEIVLMSVRIKDVLGAAYGDGFPNMVSLRKRMDEHDAAVRKADGARTDDGRVKWEQDAADALDDVRAIIYKIDDHRAAWDTVESMSNTLRRLVDTERKRLTDGKAMMRADDALTRAVMLAKSVKRHVDDSKVVAAIWDDFQRIMKGEQLS